MDTAALTQALNTQAIMGQLITKVLDQSTKLIEQQAAAIIQQTVQSSVSAALNGLGENIDVVA